MPCPAAQFERENLVASWEQLDAGGQLASPKALPSQSHPSHGREGNQVRAENQSQCSPNFTSSPQEFFPFVFNLRGKK